MFPGTDISEDSAYDWLKSIADEENWAETFESAFKIASEKGIKSVEVNTENLRIKNIVYSYEDNPAKKKYGSMITQFLTDDTENNIATYIIVDEKTVLICDEYGRTFLVKAKTIINDLVNAMIEAGYTRTVHPEKYVSTLTSPSKN